MIHTLQKITRPSESEQIAKRKGEVQRYENMIAQREASILVNKASIETHNKSLELQFDALDLNVNNVEEAKKAAREIVKSINFYAIEVYKTQQVIKEYTQKRDELLLEIEDLETQD